MRAIIYILLLSFLTPEISFAEDITIFSGALTAESYRSASASEREVYLLGFVDGILISPLLGAPQNRIKILADCVTSKSVQQLDAVFIKYLNENPETWHLSFHQIALKALSNLCKESAN